MMYLPEIIPTVWRAKQPPSIIIPMYTNTDGERLKLRPTCMRVNLDALESNFKKVQQRVGSAKILAVVKANAYGHGLARCARHFTELGASYLGVAIVEEGIAIRQAGIQTPVLVFGGIFGEQIDLYLEYNLDIAASSIEKLLAVEEAARRFGKRASVHLKIDTGMKRIGVRPESAPALFEAALRCEHVDVAGIFSHFATADEVDLQFTKEQFARFQKATASLPAFKSGRPLLHIANSAAVLQHPETCLDMVRPGIALYGVYPERHLAGHLALTPAMSLHSRVVYFKVVKKGEGVSYSLSWKAPQDSRVVTIPVGYGDGYPRALSNKGSVLIRGRRCPIVGKVCMDQTMVNVGQGEAWNGDEVVLIGEQGNEKITVTELAELAGSVPHEILTTTNLRVPRIYDGGR